MLAMHPARPAAQKLNALGVCGARYRLPLTKSGCMEANREGPVASALYTPPQAAGKPAGKREKAPATAAAAAAESPQRSVRGKRRQGDAGHCAGAPIGNNVGVPPGKRARPPEAAAREALAREAGWGAEVVESGFPFDEAGVRELVRRQDPKLTEEFLAALYRTFMVVTDEVAKMVEEEAGAEC
jgi:hypothetical protein